MIWEAWLTLSVIILISLALLRNWAGPDTVMLGGLTVLMTGSLFSPDKLPSPAEVVSGFGNEGLITLGVLYVVAMGMSQTGAMEMLASPLLGRPRTRLSAQVRLMLPVAGLSAFLNNTPIVAMFIPVVRNWCNKHHLPEGKLFIPLSYAAILGGTCTLIGTSTNIVIHGLIRDAQGQGLFMDTQIGLFSIAAVGLPALALGVIYLLIFSGPWLPDAPPSGLLEKDDTRQYIVEMMVTPGGPINGKSIEQAGLRHLPGMYLAELERQGERIVAVGPTQKLCGGDRLFFVGLVESVVDLQKIRGLALATDEVFKLHDARPNRCLVEAVVSPQCPILRQTIRQSHFRTRYQAVVIAVHRGGERLVSKIGDIVLQPGDTLLIETHPRFIEQQRNCEDFLLVSAVADSKPIRHDRAWLATGLLALLVLGVSFTPLSLLNGALIVCGLMAATGCFNMQQARQSVDLRVLLALGAAIGIGRAMEISGVSNMLADPLLQAARPFGPYALLGVIYLITMVFNMMVGNLGAAVLIFPIAKAMAITEHMSFTPIAIVLMMAASASYATPISYPTNLMVMGPGGYKSSDYLKIGLPLNLLLMILVVVLTPRIWPV